MSRLALQLLKRLPLFLSAACPADSDEMLALKREQLCTGLCQGYIGGIRPARAIVATLVLISVEEKGQDPSEEAVGS